ncbi:MAG: hypothetical protein JRI56_10900 [Deltaproteobacteria bacterium]|nr:hypothetical protein [Deltaproteobacteria bacterium]
MDIQKLRNALELLSHMFWNTTVDKQLAKEAHSNKIPIESAWHRYIVAVRNRKTAANINKLSNDVRQCLRPHNLAFQRLQDEFTTSFAKDVLSTYKDTIENFCGVSVDNFKPCVELMVCMSNKGFWDDEAPAKEGKTGKGKPGPKVKWTDKIMDRALDIIAEEKRERNRSFMESALKRLKRKYPQLKKVKAATFRSRVSVYRKEKGLRAV